MWEQEKLNSAHRNVCDSVKLTYNSTAMGATKFDFQRLPCMTAQGLIEIKAKDKFILNITN